MKRIQTEGGMAPSAGWSWNAGSATPRRRPGRRLGTFLLLLPLVVGLLGAPASPPGVRGDELSDAKARQAQLKKEVAAQKQRVADLNALQGALTAEIKNTTSELRGINADLKKVRVKITDMQTKIDVIQADYDRLVAQVKSLDAQLVVVQAREVAKKAELAERKALLSERVRSAYDTDRTSLLESFLSGGTFTDLLAEMSYFIDVGEQDKALADQIALDQATLASLHQTDRGHAHADQRAAPGDGRPEARPRREPRRPQGRQGRADQAREADGRDARGSRSGPTSGWPGTRPRPRRSSARLPPSRSGWPRRSTSSSRSRSTAATSRASSTGRCAGRWTASAISGDYGCSSFEYYAPGNGCAHYHNGIDLVGPSGAKVRAAAAGTVVYVGWNWADGPDPAWIVIIAHSGQRPLVVRPHAADPARSRSASTSTRARSSASRAAPATPPARTSTGWSS